MPHADTEDPLVEQPAIGLIAEQVALPHPHPRPFSQWEKGGRQAGLRVRSLVVLVSRLRAALERLNPALPPEAITAALTGILFERLPACRRKYRVFNEFLFEWKTSP